MPALQPVKSRPFITNRGDFHILSKKLSPLWGPWVANPRPDHGTGTNRKHTGDPTLNVLPVADSCPVFPSTANTLNESELW